MKITHIGSVLLQTMGTVLVKIKTDEGITGLGDAYHGAGVHQIVVDERLRGPLIGKDPRNVDKLYHDMMYSMSASGYYQGAVMSAISGIESALWDITAQAAGIPIWQLLGGKFRDKVPMYNTYGAALDSPEAYVAKAKELEALGFVGVKICIDPLPHARGQYNRTISNNDIAYHLKIVTAVRKALDSNTGLGVEAHWRYTPVDILKLAYAFEDLNLMFLEDPVPPENVQAMAKVVAATRTPINTGENFYTRFGFRELLEAQAADLISPDFAKAGGLLEGRRIADLADMYYVNLAPHNVGSAVQTMAKVHLCAAIPNLFALETINPGDPEWNALILESPLIQNGYITVPDCPGLGVTVNEEVARGIAKEDLGFFD